MVGWKESSVTSSREVETQGTSHFSKENNMRHIALALLGAASLIVFAVSGCSPTTLGANTGTAYYLARDNQILNPEAEMNLDPVTGLDANAAAIAVDTYRKSFEKPDAEMGRSMVSAGVQTK